MDRPTKSPVKTIIYSMLCANIIGFTTGYFFNKPNNDYYNNTISNLNTDVETLNKSLEEKTSEISGKDLLLSSQKERIDSQDGLINTYEGIIGRLLRQENNSNNNGYFKGPYYGKSPLDKKEKRI